MPGHDSTEYHRHRYELKSVEFSPKFLGLEPTVRRCLSTFA
jgi:hypothetical protein